MRATRDDLPFLFGDESAGVRGADWGGLRAVIISMPAGTDFTPLFKGLSNGLCQCPHWGYVLKGRIRLVYPDREEVVSAGELFYWPPGHTARVEEDVEFVEFSPPREHDEVLDVVKRNVAEAATA